MRYNVSLNDFLNNIFLNNLALGAEKGETFIHAFRELPHGHSSMSTLGRKDYQVFECNVLTVDEYTSDNAISKVDFTKGSVEGAEMMILKGSESLFFCSQLPIWLFVEMNTQTSAYFGYQPCDLLCFPCSKNNY